MFRKNEVKGTGTGVTLIATNCELVGDVHFSDQLQVNGIVRGNIYATEGSSASITLSEQGQVIGEIKVPKAVINGKVQGDIYSEDHIELHEKASIEGNVYYNLIEMVIGSQVDGNLVHQAAASDAQGSNVSPFNKDVPALTTSNEETI